MLLYKVRQGKMYMHAHQRVIEHELCPKADEFRIDVKRSRFFRLNQLAVIVLISAQSFCGGVCRTCAGVHNK